jgi:hypothetical protein
MAFPGTYNISYYKGDTLEFRIYPKNSNGGVFDLSGYSLVANEGAKFTIATARGTDGVGTQVTAYAKISDDRTYIQCAVRPEDMANKNARDSFVYDIVISKSSTPYNTVHTLLTGNLVMTDEVVEA